MATGADLLAAMGDLNDEISTASGGADHTRALRALNRAQDLLELQIQNVPNVYGSYTTVSTAASTEVTALPTGYTRIDRLQFIDPATSLPSYSLRPVREVGDALLDDSSAGPWVVSSASVTGKPHSYTMYGGNFHWSPVPDATHTIRVYGFSPASDITNVGTFTYGDQFIWPMAAVAVRMFKQRLDDPQEEILMFAAETFGAVLKQLARRDNDGPTFPRYFYSYSV